MMIPAQATIAHGAGAAGRSGGHAGRSDRGRATGRQRSVAGVGSHQPLVHRVALGGGGDCRRDRGGELRPDAAAGSTASSSTYAASCSAIAGHGKRRSRARAELFSSVGGEGLSSIPGGWRAKYLDLLTRCWLRARPAAEAERAVRVRRRDRCRDTGLRTASGWADRAARGRRARRRRRATAPPGSRWHRPPTADEAGAAARGGAVANAGRPGARPRLGEAERAVAELEHAVVALEACGAERYRLEAERELGKLGRARPPAHAPRQGERTGVESLTQRELELARLVVDRKTNPEIAATLFLSQKTVETPPAEHVPQARRRVTRRAGAHGRAVRPRGDLTRIRRNLLRLGRSRRSSSASRPRSG